MNSTNKAHRLIAIVVFTIAGAAAQAAEAADWVVIAENNLVVRLAYDAQSIKKYKIADRNVVEVGSKIEFVPPQRYYDRYVQQSLDDVLHKYVREVRFTVEFDCDQRSYRHQTTRFYYADDSMSAVANRQNDDAFAPVDPDASDYFLRGTYNHLLDKACR